MRPGAGRGRGAAGSRERPALERGPRRLVRRRSILRDALESGETARQPQTQTGALCVFLVWQVNPGWNFCPFEKKNLFLRCASFLFSAQTCVLGHTSPLEGSCFQAAVVGLRDVGLSLPYLPDLASILSWVSPASSVQWDGSASQPEGWTGRPAGTHRTFSPSLSLFLRPQVTVA